MCNSFWMSAEEKKQAYIHVAADLTILQRIICCTHDTTVSAADTPRNRTKSHPDESPHREIEMLSKHDE